MTMTSTRAAIAMASLFAVLGTEHVAFAEEPPVPTEARPRVVLMAPEGPLTARVLNELRYGQYSVDWRDSAATPPTELRGEDAVVRIDDAGRIELWTRGASGEIERRDVVANDAETSTPGAGTEARYASEVLALRAVERLRAYLKGPTARLDDPASSDDVPPISGPAPTLLMPPADADVSPRPSVPISPRVRVSVDASWMSPNLFFDSAKSPTLTALTVRAAPMLTGRWGFGGYLRGMLWSAGDLSVPFGGGGVYGEFTPLRRIALDATLGMDVFFAGPYDVLGSQVFLAGTVFAAGTHARIDLIDADRWSLFVRGGVEAWASTQLKPSPTLGPTLSLGGSLAFL